MQSSCSEGDNLIFLISQPRAGSTLTQKILGRHPEIHTTSEPWLMLHPLYALREVGYKAEYDSRLAKEGAESFLSQLVEDGRQLYLNSVAQLYGTFYQQATKLSGKKFFLDKTPRYYNIIPELHQTFPKAKFLILLRNPLAVLCSIISTWNQDHWLALHHSKHDLLDAPALLLNGIESIGSSATVLHYEEILENFDYEMGRVCNQLNIDFFPDLQNYGKTNLSFWAMGDQKSVYEQSKPDAANINRWLECISHPQIWRLVSDYLDFLGSETMLRLGYDYAELRFCLDERHPGKLKMWNTMPLDWLLKSKSEFNSLNYGFYPIRLLDSLQRQGIFGTVIGATKKIVRWS